jgi:hypothetical protein
MAAFIELGIIVGLVGLIIWAIKRKRPGREESDKRRPD